MTRVEGTCDDRNAAVSNCLGLYVWEAPSQLRELLVRLGLSLTGEKPATFCRFYPRHQFQQVESIAIRLKEIGLRVAVTVGSSTSKIAGYKRRHVTIDQEIGTTTNAIRARSA